ncbi:Similar to CHRNA7: Neuronal acetylcholine receptor subunit alpha-7 (Gallus gallus) [Cotesia congregata]|uniref:Similar to CHRNA7: Neuronal acetylcholine receptor subunit alpha-7 (Gallus gallus) n=1 Tax=Cotesia congregata TaxID=51543 RepID=A0A8J2EHE6_COTCN|nr:Similar to CHRNA7: Neuronal acetylcholine receptor subunit alpha-7 (Gallus gallus) [Cotesia congregata]
MNLIKKTNIGQGDIKQDGTNVSCVDDEHRLAKYLLDNYDAGVRPAKNSTQPLVVIFGLSLHHIIDVDEKNQILTTNCWVTQTWTDYHLQWNTSEFAGIQVIRVPYNRVWRPDIILYNKLTSCADPQYSSAVINTNVIISHTGQVVWLSHGIFRSSCNIDVEFFPFDEQKCLLKWASWTYDGYQLESQSEQGDISNYQANGEFDLVNFTAQRNIEFYSCCPEPYPDITYAIRLRRRPMFYVFNLILPCILINGIALLVFYVPSESGEKVTLGISALLSMTVFLMTIRETLPPTEKTPLISLYYGVSICLVSFASGLAVVTLNFHHRGLRGSKVSPLVKSLVLEKLARLVFLKFSENQNNTHLNEYEDSTDITLEQNTCPLHYPTLGQRSTKLNTRCESHDSSTSLDSTREENVEEYWSKILRKVHSTIEKNERRLSDQDQREQTELEWKQIALVSDRVLLCIFFLTTAISTAVILSGSPPTEETIKG